MTPELRILIQLTDKNVFESSRKTEGDLKAWLAKQEYLLDESLLEGNANKANAFNLRFSDKTGLYSALANDCNRFAQAAIESMWLLEQAKSLPKNTAWATVQMYYSAFFAAHSLLRMFGRACTQLEPEHVKKVYKVAEITQSEGVFSKIESGFYFSEIDINVIRFSKIKESHGDTWKSLRDLFDWIIENISTTQGIRNHKESTSDLISKIKNAISRGGATRGNWPSMVRNKVNYQQSHGTWFPYRGALHNREKFFNKSTWLTTPEKFDFSVTNDEISELRMTCNCILSLMYHLLRVGHERSQEASSIMDNGTFRLLRQIKVISAEGKA
ncbi:MAG: hypothetical protein NXH96_16985 [Alteromonadaceae bacterium]|nr:hypothetical protein [Alteromonadaceae bacterium]